MKEAFDVFFEKMSDSWQQVWRTGPKVPFTEQTKNCGLYVSEPDKDGYAEWQPKLQTEPVDFETIEKELGFKINLQIKEFLSTYWFMPLEGKTNTVNHLVLNELLPQCDLMQEVKHLFSKKEFHYLNKGEYFLIGGFCSINGNDSYMVHVNNDTGEVTAVQCFDKISIKIADSIKDLLVKMKGIW
jgi:hypothetical protein